MMSTEGTVWLLTTVDNPFSPFDDFRNWYLRDTALGYNTCGLIARLAPESDDFNDEPELDAMRTIIEHNWYGKHVMVTKETWAETINSSTPT